MGEKWVSMCLEYRWKISGFHSPTADFFVAHVQDIYVVIVLLFLVNAM